MMQTTDYIVVGAGSAGAVLAARLSEDGKSSVLLIEAGGRDAGPSFFVPGLMPRVIRSPQTNWHYPGAADPTLHGRSLSWAAGKVLGGSSSINGMVFVRGLKSGFDNWSQSGATGWDWDGLLPYFRKLETWDGEANPSRGTSGPIGVRRFTETNAAAATWLDAASASGIVPYVPDHNNGVDEGVSLNQASQIQGMRCSTSGGYLRAKGASNTLAIKTGLTVIRLMITGTRCTGVVTADGQSFHVTREVIVCAGAIGSPKLLMLSGIGDPNCLHPLGIRVIHDLPSVGDHLNEHLNTKIMVRSRARTYSSEGRGLRYLTGAVRWLGTRSGPAASPVGHVQAFLKTTPDLPAANIQVQVIPMGFPPAAVEDGDLCSAVISLTRPRSRGRINLLSMDPRVPPQVAINLLSEMEDIRELAAGCDVVRQIHARGRLSGGLQDEILPGSTHGNSLSSWRDYFAAHGALNWHPTSTCRMGSDDRAVVDLSLRVRGIDGLRICDASVMPTVTAGNTNAPVIAVAEKLADIIKDVAMIAG
jgi:choline dehydrogenase